MSFAANLFQMAMVAILFLNSPVSVFARQVKTETQPSISLLDETPTAEQIAQQMVDIQSISELDEAARTLALQLLQKGQKGLEIGKASMELSAKFERMAQSVSEQKAALSNQQKSLAAPKSSLLKDASSDQLKQQLVSKQAELEQAKKEVAEFTAEPARRLQRAGDIPKLLAEKQSELDKTQEQLQVEPPASEPSVVTLARMTQLKCEKWHSQKELEMLAAEQKAYAATDELVPLQLNVASLRQGTLQLEVDEIQQALNQIQSNEVSQSLDAARRAVDRAPLQFKDWAKQNQLLAEKRKSYVEQDKIVSEQLKIVKGKSEDVDRQFKTLTERVSVVGLTEAMGLMIKQQREDLLKLQDEISLSNQSSVNIRDLQLESFRYKDDLAALPNDRQLIEQLVALIPGGTPNEQQKQREFAAALVSQRRALLPAVVTTTDGLFRNLFQLDTESKILSGKIDNAFDYIDQRLVWIPSCPPLGKSDSFDVMGASQWLLNPLNWQELWRSIVGELTQRPFRYIPSFAGLLLLVVLHGRFKKILAEAGEIAKKGRCSDMAPTWQAIMATFLLSTGWPLLAMTIGWILTSYERASNFPAGVGWALLQISLYFLPIELLRNVCRPNGLVAAHFDWPERLRKFFVNNLRWFNLVTLPSLFVVLTLENQRPDEWKFSLGRLAAILLFMALAVLMHRLWRPDGAFFQNLAVRGSGTALYRFRSLWYLLMIGFPIVLAALTGMGYYYTALVLGAGMVRTAGAAVFLVLVGGVALRLVLMRRRKQAIEENRKLRLAAAATAQAATSGSNELPTESTPQAVAEPNLDLASVNRQAREIVFFAISSVAFIWLYFIWREVLPAIGFLDQTELWNVSLGDKVDKVSLKDVLFALISFGLTFLMIKNMPGLLNLLAQQYSTLDAGTRYAATTIFRYLITVIGAVIGLSFLKIPWSQYSWLVAAVTVGLGFGLQEIVANFVSGLILLFERPVRVGDLVTIDGTTGVVTKIQMRATTVTNWDHQELIVPNKDLITGKLLNWTLSNVINRLVLNVGVAYGTDTNRVQGILMKVVTSHPEVLSDPPPMVSFEEFGDSSLNFVIRCFLPSVDRRTEIRHELNTGIAESLRKAHIEIPFPRRDIHIIDSPKADSPKTP